jgi:hypothetical protein
MRGSDFLHDASLQAAWRDCALFAVSKQHYSLYPVGASLLAPFQDEFAAYGVDRGTIRFRLNAPMPVKLIEGRLPALARRMIRHDESVLVCRRAVVTVLSFLLLLWPQPVPDPIQK